MNDREAVPPSHGPRRRLLRPVAVALPLMVVFYGLLYFPYAPDSIPARVLEGYLALIARLCGGLLRLTDASIQVTGTAVHGRFPLQIVLDCAALDAQAFLIAAVLGFPTSWSRRALGIGSGVAAITVANLGRIVALYFVGLHWPASFHFWHEEVLQFAMVAVAVVSFAGWVLWTGRARMARADAP